MEKKSKHNCTSCKHSTGVMFNGRGYDPYGTTFCTSPEMLKLTGKTKEGRTLINGVWDECEYWEKRLVRKE